MEEEASRWSENCHFQIQRIGNGENLAMHTADKQLEDLLEEGFNMWSSGKDEYKYGDKLSSKTGHYTQVFCTCTFFVLFIFLTSSVTAEPFVDDTRI